MLGRRNIKGKNYRRMKNKENCRRKKGKMKKMIKQKIILIYKKYQNVKEEVFLKILVISRYLQ